MLGVPDQLQPHRRAVSPVQRSRSPSPFLLPAVAEINLESKIKDLNSFSTLNKLETPILEPSKQNLTTTDTLSNVDFEAKDTRPQHTNQTKRKETLVEAVIPEPAKTTSQEIDPYKAKRSTNSQPFGNVKVSSTDLVLRGKGSAKDLISAAKDVIGTIKDVNQRQINCADKTSEKTVSAQTRIELQSSGVSGMLSIALDIS